MSKEIARLLSNYPALLDMVNLQRLIEALRTGLKIVLVIKQ
ncbi:MAG: hypothetical protein V1936_03015 [Patescibacteria group bacterium]